MLGLRRRIGAASAMALAVLLAPDAASGEDFMEESCRREVFELHQFFQDWFNAVLDPTEKDFARFAEVMDEDFVLISPSGTMTERGPLVERLRGAHGVWAETGRIWIENVRLHRRFGDDVAVVTYEEWQDSGGEVRGRLSTAIFGRRQGAPNGVVWLHLHEVWLPEKE